MHDNIFLSPFQGNDIRMVHYPSTSTSNPLMVPLVESAWQRPADGQPMDREHMLMALANVQHILIRATYVEGATELGYVRAIVVIQLLRFLPVYRAFIWTKRVFFSFVGSFQYPVRYTVQ